MPRARTNLELEEAYLETIMNRYHLWTKTEPVDLALRDLAGQPMTLDEALGMRGAHAIGLLPEDQPPSAGS